jgi:hypothetical protein
MAFDRKKISCFFLLVAINLVVQHLRDFLSDRKNPEGAYSFSMNGNGNANGGKRIHFISGDSNLRPH